MTKVLVLYYSAYGHIETLAHAIGEGARAEGADVTVGRVPDNIPENVAKAQHYKLDQTAPLIDHNTLPEYDAIIVGTGTRYGRISSQMAAFWDRTGGLWAKGALVGKVGASFTSSATQHGGQELTHISILSNLLHHGMTIVGLDYGFAGQMDNSAITGGSPYGVSTIAGGDGSMHPTQHDLASAKYLGAKVARIAAKITA